MVVHLYGKACEMTSIMQLAGKYNLQLIEDCAQAHGAKYKGQKVGTFGTGAFFFLSYKKFRSTWEMLGLLLLMIQKLILCLER